jgi:hypothetical protein
MYTNYAGQGEKHAMALHQVFQQGMFERYQKETAAFTRDYIKTLSGEQQEQIQRFKAMRVDGGELGKAYQARYDEPKFNGTRAELAKMLIKKRAYQIHGDAPSSVMKAGVPGVTTTLGYNFYDLRAPVQLLYPVNVPFRNNLPRISRVNDGWGTAAHWMATRNVGTQYAGVIEGERGAYSVPDQNSYTATYKELGVERAVTFTAQFAGEGFADNLADEHIRGLHSLWLQEEGMMLHGNSGTASGNNGFQMGVAPTPSVAAPSAGGSLTSGVTVSVFVVALTAMGYPNNTQYGYLPAPTVATGLTPTFTRNNADGSSNVLNGGISQVSLVGTAGSATSGSNLTVVATCASVYGAAGYAWYVNITDTTKANAFLYAITAFPKVTINSNPTNTNQSAAAAGLSSDHSYQTTDFDGLTTYASSTIGGDAPGSTGGTYFKDLVGASLTPGKDGSVVEIEAALEDRWNQFQAPISTIWCGSQARLTLDQAMKYGGSNGQPGIMYYQPGAQGDLAGGYFYTRYQSKWSMDPSGGGTIPIRLHPMLPPNWIFLDIDVNPYPHSRIPFTRGILEQRSPYSIEWPLVTREWTFGTYVHEVLAHNIPWISGQIVGVGPFVGN